MNMLRLIKAGLALAALAGLLLSGSPGLADSKAEWDLKTQAQAAIEQAVTLIDERAIAAAKDDEDAQDQLRDAEVALMRAENRFGSGNYEGALDHAKEVEEMLK